MDARDKYEAAGRALVAEIEALPADHPLVEWLAGSRQYRALSEDNPLDEVWQGSPTNLGVRHDYLFRFDLPASLTRGKLNQGATAAKITALAESVRSAGNELQSALDAHLKKCIDDRLAAIAWLNSELARNKERLESAGYSIEQARNSILRKFVRERMDRLTNYLRERMLDSSKTASRGRASEQDFDLTTCIAKCTEALNDHEAVRREIKRLTGENL